MPVGVRCSARVCAAGWPGVEAVTNRLRARRGESAF